MENIGFLRNEANFEVKLYKDLTWVPVNSLGKGRYTNIESVNALLLPPTDRRKLFGNLYEVLQSFLLSNFKYIMDVEYSDFKGVIWEIHKTAEEIVYSNSGCCYAVASWVKYFLDEIYEENGFLSFVRPNGTGHVMNYIRHNGWYYVIDLTPYVLSEKYKMFYESGNKIDYLRSNNVTGILTKCKELKSYALYYDRLQSVGGFNFIYFISKEKNVVPIAIRQTDNKIAVIYPNFADVECIYNGSPKVYSMEWSEFNEV